MTTRHPNIRKPFKIRRWQERTSGVWTNKQGYTLTKSGDRAWRLSDPTGRFLAEQLELFDGDSPLTAWADEYIRALDT